MAEVGEGENARGLFSSASGGRAFRSYRRRTKMGALDRFAELLSEHDLETGDLGGNVRVCARRMGVKPTAGNVMLQRIRKRLGWQAS